MYLRKQKVNVVSLYSYGCLYSLLCSALPVLWCRFLIVLYVFFSEVSVLTLIHQKNKKNKNKK